MRTRVSMTTTALSLEQVLHASLDMRLAQLPPKGASVQQREAVKKGATVLSEDDHDQIMEELRQR